MQYSLATSFSERHNTPEFFLSQATGEPRWMSIDEIRWDEKAGLRRDAVGSQVIDALEAQEIKETGNEED